MSDSVRPHRRQRTRLPRPWDSPGKNTGVGCHFLLQCMKVKSESEVAQSCLTLSDPMDCGPPGSSVHGLLQVRIQEWAALPSSGKFSPHRDWTRISCTAGRFFTTEQAWILNLRRTRVNLLPLCTKNINLLYFQIKRENWAEPSSLSKSWNVDKAS